MKGPLKPFNSIESYNHSIKHIINVLLVIYYKWNNLSRNVYKLVKDYNI